MLCSGLLNPMARESIERILREHRKDVSAQLSHLSTADDENPLTDPSLSQHSFRGENGSYPLTAAPNWYADSGQSSEYVGTPGSSRDSVGSLPTGRLSLDSTGSSDSLDEKAFLRSAIERIERTLATHPSLSGVVRRYLEALLTYERSQLENLEKIEYNQVCSMGMRRFLLTTHSSHAL